MKGVLWSRLERLSMRIEYETSDAGGHEIELCVSKFIGIQLAPGALM